MSYTSYFQFKLLANDRHRVSQSQEFFFLNLTVVSLHYFIVWLNIKANNFRVEKGTKGCIISEFSYSEISVNSGLTITQFPPTITEIISLLFEINFLHVR